MQKSEEMWGKVVGSADTVLSFLLHHHPYQRTPTNMALAASLLPGFKYRINSGIFKDEVVTIINNTPFADNDPEGRQRKITVLTPVGTEMYVLPRMLDDKPVGIDGGAVVSAPRPTAVAAPAPVSGPVPPFVPPSKESISALVESHRLNPITDPMDKRLDHLRPSRAKTNRYFSRVMDNGMTDVEFLLTYTNDFYREKNEGRPANIMLKGHTQTGKTFLVEKLAVAWADKMGLPKPLPIFTLSGSTGVTDFDLFGQTTSYTDPETNREWLVWLSGVVELATSIGGVLYLDEINALLGGTTSSLHSVTDHRHQFVNRNKPVFRDGQFMPDVVVSALDLWVIGTYNHEGYQGMGRMNEAFGNRFRHIIWDYDKTVEAKLINSAAIRIMGERLRLAFDNKQLQTPVGTSALQRCEEDVHSFGIALGMQVFLGMFKTNERGVVDSILEDGSIYVLLQEEDRQREIEAQQAQLQP